MGGEEVAKYLQEDGYIRLLQCFLNPALMVQRKEAPNALTDQQLGADGRARVICKEGQQVDPIYLLFMPEESEKLGKEDTVCCVLYFFVSIIVVNPQCTCAKVTVVSLYFCLSTCDFEDGGIFKFETGINV